MLDQSIVLIGMPGSGKSTVGKLLAKKTKSPFVDTDKLIIAASGKPLQRIIEEDGLSKFNQYEHDVIMNLNPEVPTIIATGGSAVLNHEAMMHLKDVGVVIFLDADLPLLRKRLWNFESRGIVLADTNDSNANDSNTNDKENSILEIYKIREPMYFKYCDMRVHVHGLGTNKIVAKIIEDIKKGRR